ncbi:MAG: 2-dehydro-3-deoxygalactonokinase [Clostridia bacterium]|nr:2-dehydro-3-deoxygalactonokinase [Clostridia bacterium]
MADYIVIDGGTTNTRVSLVSDGEVLETKRFNIGAKKSIDGNNSLKLGVKNSIEELLNKNEKTANCIECIIASGMITSEFGLFELKHLTVPAGIKELNAGMKKVVLDDICEIPFVFIPGVKLACTGFDDSDMMRGEEVELVGILGETESVYVLPGSHSKAIRTDADGRITDFCTMLTGEMIGAIAQETILRDALDMTISETDSEYLLSGYEYCCENGINKSLFRVRAMKNLLGATAKQVYSFFMGIMLHDEIVQLLSFTEKKIVLGGKKQLRCAMTEILKVVSDKEIICLSDDVVDNANTFGMVKIYEYSCLK